MPLNDYGIHVFDDDEFPPINRIDATLNQLSDSITNQLTVWHGTPAQRELFDPPFPNAEWNDTTTPYRRWVGRFGQWAIAPGQAAGGQANTATNANGEVTISHDLGAAPAAAFASVNETTALPIKGRLIVTVKTKTASNVTFVVYREDTGAILAGNPLMLDWIVVA